MPSVPYIDPAQHLGALTRRHFFSRCALGLGGIALASMLGEKKLYGAGSSGGMPGLPNPMAPRTGHHAPPTHRATS